MKPLRIDASFGRSRIIDTLIIDPHCLPVSSSQLSFYYQFHHPKFPSHHKYILHQISYEMAYNLLSDMEVYGLGATAPIRPTPTTKHKHNHQNQNLSSSRKVELLEPGHFWIYENDKRLGPTQYWERMRSKPDSLLKRVTTQMYDQLRWIFQQADEDQMDTSMVRIKNRKRRLEAEEEKHGKKTMRTTVEMTQDHKETPIPPSNNTNTQITKEDPMVTDLEETVVDTKEKSTNIISSPAPDITPSSSSNTNSENSVPQTTNDPPIHEPNNLQQIHIQIRENDIVIHDSFLIDKYLPSSSHHFPFQGASPVDIANQIVSDLNLPHHCAVSITSSILEQLHGIPMWEDVTTAAGDANPTRIKGNLLVSKNEPMTGAWRMGAKEKMMMDSVVFTNNYLSKR